MHGSEENYVQMVMGVKPIRGHLLAVGSRLV